MMSPRIYTRVLFCSFLFASFSLAQEEASEAHPLLEAYERAAAVQAHLQDRWVLNQSLYPRWIDETRFWYQRETPEGSEYSLGRCDALGKSTGLRSPGTC